MNAPQPPAVRGVASPALPRWLADVLRLSTIRAQFVLAGNIRDLCLVPGAPAPTLLPLIRALWNALAPLGYKFLVLYDPVDGVRVYPAEEAVRESAVKLIDLPRAPAGAAGAPMGLEALGQLAAKIVALREARVALVIDFASRLLRSPSTLDAAEHKFFVAAEKLAVTAHPIIPVGGEASPDRMPRFNPILWLVNRDQDLPSWFALDAERVETLVLPPPDFETRASAAQLLGGLFPQFDADDRSFVRRFADSTDGLTLTAMTDIAQLAAAQQLPASQVDDAVRCYKVGAVENPWRKDYLRERIRDAAEAIGERVKGQRQAVVKTVDILMRSVMGLTGAQARSGGNRPRGVLFFAGPTGVGKTETAKALTEIIFGDERAYIRFDMSEFAAEHSAARLLGAPPGYIGYDAGGELTNAVRARPFSVVLFDEIEKAHPRILDKFLQILEDGRLTDGRGQTAYFSEAIIVFTSNLGIYVEDESGVRRQNVAPGEPYEEVEAKVRGAIADHFKFRLMRPEILNRIGDNVVVFDFIAPDVAARIFEGMLANVVSRVRREHGVTLTIPPALLERLRKLCTADLSNGGRGIGNRMESVFINPLARALFGAALAPNVEIAVTDLVEIDRIWTVSLQAVG